MRNDGFSPMYPASTLDDTYFQPMHPATRVDDGHICRKQALRRPTNDYLRQK